MSSLLTTLLSYNQIEVDRLHDNNIKVLGGILLIVVATFGTKWYGNKYILYIPQYPFIYKIKNSCIISIAY